MSKFWASNKNTMLKLIATFLLAGSVMSHAPDWTKIAPKLDQAVYRLSYPTGKVGETYTCTGFVINQKLHYLLTASHCLGEGLSADAVPAFPVWVDHEIDLAVISLVEPTRAALHPARRDAEWGQPIAAFGFAWSEMYPVLRVGIVANPEMPVMGLNRTWLEFDSGAIGGMSGGPVVDKHGRVVSIVLMSDTEGTGLGRTISTIWNYTKAYWQFSR